MFDLQRLKEPSTYAGIAALLTGFGLTIAPEWVESGSLIAAGLAGVVSIFLPENKRKR